MWSRRSLLQLPTQRSAMPFCQGLRNEVRLGIILVVFTAWIAFNEDETLVPLQLNEENTPSAKAFCAGFQR
jgi:hypothetical protein